MFLVNSTTKKYKIKKLLFFHSQSYCLYKKTNLLQQLVLKLNKKYNFFRLQTNYIPKSKSSKIIGSVSVFKKFRIIF